jgi:hypothetical protein
MVEIAQQRADPTPYLSGPMTSILYEVNSLFAILSMSGREERKTKSLGMTALRTSNGTMNKPKDQHDQYMLS